MKRSVGVKLPVFALLVLLLSGCLTNPITGRVGPSWTVPLGIPIASNTITLADVVKDTIETQDDYFMFHQDGEYSVSLAEQIEFTPSVTVAPETDIEIDISGKTIEVEISLEELELDELGTFDSLSFSKGTLELSFPNYPNWKINDMLIDGQDLQVGENNLAGVSFNKNSIISVTAASDSVAVVPNKIKIDFQDTELATFSGKFQPVTIAASDLNVAIDLDLEVSETVSHVLTGLTWLDASLSLEINNPTGIPINVDDLAVKFTGDSDSILLSFVDATKTVEGTKTKYMFKPENDDKMIAAIKSIPHSLALEGNLVIGDGQKVDFQLADLEINVALDLNSRFTFDLDVLESITAGPFAVDAIEDLKDNLDKYTEEAYIYANVYNNLPVAAELELQLSRDENNWEEAVSIQIGQVHTGEENKLVFPINQSVREILETGGYSQVVVSLLGEGSQDYNIKATDHIKIIIWAEVKAKINH